MDYNLNHFTYSPLYFTILSRWKYIIFILFLSFFIFHSHSAHLLNFIIQKRHSMPDKNLFLSGIEWKTHLQNATSKTVPYFIEMIIFHQLGAFWSSHIEQIVFMHHFWKRLWIDGENYGQMSGRWMPQLSFTYLFHSVGRWVLLNFWKTF